MQTRLRRSAKVASVVVASLSGCALIIACFYPGYMSSDSVDQLGQARSAIYTSSHPPVMAWVWHRTDALLPGPLGMVALQDAFFFGGAALLSALAMESLSALAVVAIALLPPVFALLGTAWKDVQMGAALTAAFALLCYARVSGRRGWVAPSLVLLWYAFAVRHNAPAAVLPLAFLAVAAFLPDTPRRHPALVFAGGCSLMLVLAGLTVAFDRAITQGREASPIQSQQALLHDLVGLSAATHTDLLPRYLERGPQAVSLSRLLPLYTPQSADPITFNPGAHVFAAQDPADQAELRRRWLDAVRAHPRIYLRHRWQLMSTLLGLHGKVWYPFHFQIDRNPYGVELRPSAANRSAMRALNAVRDSCFFRGWVYLLALFAMAAVAVVRGFRVHWASGTLAASGIAYTVPYFFLAPTPDFRYLWWTVLCAALLPLALLLERRAGRPPAGREALARGGSLG